MSVVDKGEANKAVVHLTVNEFWNSSEMNVLAEQAKLAAAQRTKEALEMMSLGSTSARQTCYRQSRYEPRFKVLERDICP